MLSKAEQWCFSTPLRGLSTIDQAFTCMAFVNVSRANEYEDQTAWCSARASQELHQTAFGVIARYLGRELVTRSGRIVLYRCTRRDARGEAF
jgi:hypothetical protein